jgi:hypothetical protein
MARRAYAHATKAEAVEESEKMMNVLILLKISWQFQ